MDSNTAKLYIVPTPIGNLGDITARALDALGCCDAVYAEDTRVTGRLLAAFGIKKPIQRLDENMIRQRSMEVIERIREGETVCYCSDAGMPGLSDPGSYLIAVARHEGVPCEVLPGPSAAVLAYVCSGFPSASYYFGGFFPRKRQAQADILDSLRSLDAALVFYESPHRLVGALSSIRDAFPYRDVCVCRELTKLHEEVFRGTSADVLEHFEELEATEGIKGEIVLVIDSPAQQEADDLAEDNAEAARQMIEDLIDSGERAKTAALRASAAFGIPKNEAYDMALEAKRMRKDA